MNAKSTGEDTSSAPSALEYGASFNQALCERLERHFSDATDDPEGKGKRALVVGLFGEWGCGKTLHLRHIEHHFAQKLPATKQDAIPEAGLTLPVLFNAWRYETEEHLIIPLLKTTQHRLRKWIESQYTSVDRVDQKIKSAYQQLSDTVIALVSGFEGELGGEGAKVSFKSDAALESYSNRRKKHEDETKSYSDRLMSLYYDFETEIRRLTGREGDGSKLNFLFLIDDLDRCLPEKAVKVLESIKLFLDAEGCAFVIALDDEVVERGIAHRYRDYGLIHREHDQTHAKPISGSEYLEKIVQLPVPVPAPTLEQVESYMLKNFRSLFGNVEINAAQPSKNFFELEVERQRSSGEKNDEQETRQLLLKLVCKAVPKVPRKLNRVGEMYGLYIKIAGKNKWPMQLRSERLTLLRLVIMQLLAPNLYRFGRYYPVFLDVLEGWYDKYKMPVNLAKIEGDIHSETGQKEEVINKNPNDLAALNDIHIARRYKRPLVDLVRAAQQHRSRFDPFNLVDIENRSEGDLSRYFNLENQREARPLVDFAAPASFKVVAEAGIGEFIQKLGGPNERPAIAPSDPEEFFHQLFSSDPTAWRNAIEQEAEQLTGRVLDDASFRALLDRVHRAPHVVSVRWVELLEPYLTADQFVALYRQSKLLQRLNDAMPGTKPS